MTFTLPSKSCLLKLPIDNGRSVLLSKAKNPPAKQSHLKGSYKDTYVAPELVVGSGKPSVKSDIHSLAFLIKTVRRLLKAGKAYNQRTERGIKCRDLERDNSPCLFEVVVLINENSVFKFTIVFWSGNSAF